MSIKDYFDDLELMEKKVNEIVSKKKVGKLFFTDSDVGSLKVGGDDFTVLIPNGYGDGTTEVYITSKDIKLKEDDGFQYFSLLEGIIHIYDYDCGNNVIHTTHEGRFQAWYGNKKVILNKIH